jgi:hypothetical protein
MRVFEPGGHLEHDEGGDGCKLERERARVMQQQVERNQAHDVAALRPGKLCTRDVLVRDRQDVEDDAASGEPAMFLAPIPHEAEGLELLVHISDGREDRK